MNDGVQGGSPAFKHTFNFFKRYGHEPEGVRLQVAFGQGKDSFWTNCFPSHLVDQFSADIRKFGKVLKIIKWTMPILGIVPIRIMLRMFLFNKEFGDKMVFPLIALFLGTGKPFNIIHHIPPASNIVQATRLPTFRARSLNVCSTTPT